jgi:hypothetical protein
VKNGRFVSELVFKLNHVVSVELRLLANCNCTCTTENFCPVWCFGCLHELINLNFCGRTVDSKKLAQIFERYDGTGDDAGVICEEKMARFFQDIQVDPQGMMTLAFAWKIKAKKPGEFNRQEFVAGLAELKADSLEKIAAEVKATERSLADPKTFKTFYRWLFDFSLEENKKFLAVGNSGFPYTFASELPTSHLILEHPGRWIWLSSFGGCFSVTNLCLQTHTR